MSETEVKEKKGSIAKKSAEPKKKTNNATKKTAVAKESSTNKADTVTKTETKAKKEIAKTPTIKVKKQNSENWNAFSTGKRKATAARIFISKSENHSVTVNDKDFDDFFGPRRSYRARLLKPFLTCGLKIEDYKIKITSSGGGMTGIIDSIQLGLSRSLMSIVNLEQQTSLKRSGLLTRDSRVVEPKKYGLRKARKREQFSKR